MRYQTAGGFVITHKARNRKKAKQQGEEFLRRMKQVLEDGVEDIVLVGYTEQKMATDKVLGEL